MTFQDIILELQRYWASHGCAIVQPWDVEKGAGTFNAATYLRALGPEPWRTAYVEPSRRPTDGRYGENPNRLERHHQFQVLLKPSPKDVQALYLGSLKAIGIDPADHDIRFVEDNWESPTLGAWGLGWEVWCDGMEITQFTYFQQCGGFDLNPIAVELTYGLERIAMYVQNVEDVYDIQWVGDLTYGDMRHPDEVQWSKHNFEHGNIELHLRWFNELKDECIRLCDLGLPIPAYDYCLRCSHVFNILDARGAIGVTERQAYILRVRELSKRCAETYLEHRESLGYPLLKDTNAVSAPAVPAVETTIEDGTGSFLLELGTEEIPASMAHRAARNMLKLVKDACHAWGLETIEGEHVDCTPRRMVIAFDALSLAQADREEIAKGPPKRIAYDENGEPTRAGQAFLDKVGPNDHFFIEDTPKGEYLMVRRKEAGRSTRSLLAEALPGLIAKMHWAKPMRWGHEKTPFVRPIHWILCALNDAVVPFAFADVTSGLESRGHRFHAPDPFEVKSWDSLESELMQRKVLLSSDARRERVRNAVAELAATVGGRPVEDAALLDEVTHILEWPVALLGSFEPELLELPRQAVVTPMRVHQRYFPIEDSHGNLMPHFVVVAGSETRDGAIVAHGNARVLRARLADARFFFENDLKKPLETFLPNLETRIWLSQLGSIREKVERLVGLVKAMGGDDSAQRAALLCKADLATDMVGEFAKLQGEMGRVYARHHGESDEIAEALYEHYLPRHASDELPSTLAGTYLALADRMDSIVGCFGVNLKPTGSKDPYALRRQCIGVINILRQTTQAVPLDVEDWLDASMAVYGDKIDAECRQAILDFVAERTRYLLRESLPTDVVDAVVGVGASRPADVYGKIDALSILRDEGGLEPILTTFKRVANITKGVEANEAYDTALLVEPAERDLLSSFERSRNEVETCLQSGAYARATTLMAALRPLVSAFFDDVLVMAEDEKIRAARLGLLVSIRDLFGGIADFSRIQDRKASRPQ